MSKDEFAELTPGEFRALCKRRNIRIKYGRFAGALSAAAVYNVHRGEDSPIITAMDFVRDDAAQREIDRKREVRRTVNQLGMVAGDRKRILKLRAKMLAGLKAQGHQDAEEICRAVWPSLVPTDEDKE